MEPCEPCRDEMPVILKTQEGRTVYRIRVVKDASDAVWRAIMTNPTANVMMELSELADRQALALYG